MIEKTINLRSDKYPVIHDVVRLAEKEERALSNMVGILLREAIIARITKDEGTGKEAQA